MINSYHFGTIIIDNKHYNTDIIIYPDRINNPWWRKEGHNLSASDIKEVLEYKPEMLVIGRGEPGLMKVSREIQELINNNGIKLFVGSTAEAVQVYNKHFQDKSTVGAFHLSC